ncbi:hypothetical protein [Maribacter sp. 4U21]|uniref:hypothetical protein n=1 Tax=Maribacter sp. 4U21 TaxID=1889779 RepID=UPI00117CF3E8|nr:hypothetical protein [Maribacter sp. 4U21]
MKEVDFFRKIKFSGIFFFVPGDLDPYPTVTYTGIYSIGKAPSKKAMLFLFPLSAWKRSDSVNTAHMPFEGFKAMRYIYCTQQEYSYNTANAELNKYSNRYL